MANSLVSEYCFLVEYSVLLHYSLYRE